MEVAAKRHRHVAMAVSPWKQNKEQHMAVKRRQQMRPEIIHHVTNHTTIRYRRFTAQGRGGSVITG
jgi:hypothetical protein